MKVLWLMSWYPNKLSPYAGDFLKRHAEAVSLYEDVHVIFVVKDVYGEITNDVFVEENISGRLTETIVYYHVKKYYLSALEKLMSHRKYLELYRKHIRKKVQSSKPSLIHVHIGMKAGVPGMWAKRKFKIPLLVSDQWTGLLQESLDNFDHLPVYAKKLWYKIIASADEISAVSTHLGVAIKRRFNIKQCRVIPNVVDTRIFFMNENTVDRSNHFIHISTLADFKNPDLIIQAFYYVTKKNPNAKLSIIGPYSNDYRIMIEQLGLQNNIFMVGEMPQTLLVKKIKKSDALILYSRYETFGCVIIVAQACGIPVIVSDIPVMHETVQEGINGFFAPPQNAQALAATIVKFMQDKPSIDRSAISAKVSSKYSYRVVGKMFSDWYNEVLR